MAELTAEQIREYREKYQAVDRAIKPMREAMDIMERLELRDDTMMAAGHTLSTLENMRWMYRHRLGIYFYIKGT